jgi:hypothetical protein
VIPTLILVGLVLGRWWRLVIPAASVWWVVTLMSDGIGSGVNFALGAALFAALNTAFGVLLFQIVRAVVVVPARWREHRRS